jgi:hypothetical protein
MLTFLFLLLLSIVFATVGAVSSLLIVLLGVPVRVALAIRRSRWLRRLLPDSVLLGAFRLTPVGGGMGNLLIGGGNLYGGTGAPTDAALGGAPANGDFYFRIDGAATTCIYQRRAGAWVATAA